MKTLYLDCGMGAAGDMLTAALLELIPNREEFLAELNSLGIPGVTVSSEVSAKCGIQGTHITVRINDEEESEEMHEHMHEHSHVQSHMHEYTNDGEIAHCHIDMNEIEHIIECLPISEKVKTNIMTVYALIAEAESHAHGVPVAEIHFHEVGTMDAIADITAVCMLMDRLSPEQVVVSPIHVGSGHVKCAHGILPVPAPATAYILRDVPVYGGGIKNELCTPTGAALLKHFATKFGNMPVMRTSAIGYGMGQKHFIAANCVRAFIGETEDFDDTIIELCCKFDGVTAEAIAYIKKQFIAAGALDVYNVPIETGLPLPCTLLCIVCRRKDKAAMMRLFISKENELY